jgi:hypothetical protein
LGHSLNNVENPETIEEGNQSGPCIFRRSWMMPSRKSKRPAQEADEENLRNPEAYQNQGMG